MPKKTVKMTKADLISYLDATEANFITEFASLVLLLDDDALKILEKTQASIKGKYSLPLDYVATKLKKPENKEHVFSELTKTYMKCLIRDSLQLIKEYCEDSNQVQLLKQQSWYHFARILRNAFSHDNRFVFNTEDKKVLPVTWRQKTITATMQGTDVEVGFFGVADAWELFSDMNAFVQGTLK